MQNIALIEQIVLIIEHDSVHLLAAVEHPFRHLLVLHVHLHSALQEGLMHLHLHSHAVARYRQLILHLLSYHAQISLLYQLLSGSDSLALHVVLR